jgi:ABC-type multidrug transport system permease subunit
MRLPGLFGLIDRPQASALADRYLDVFLGDWKGLAFLVLQPLAVAVCAGTLWRGVSPGPTLYFVVSFATIFFGCVNACREIVKEGAIYRRERLVNLQIPAYVASKLWILALLGFGQTLLFELGLRYFLVLDGQPALFFLALYAGLLAGTALGLLISALVSVDVVALALVPVCLIPQLLFSKLIMPARSLEGPLAALEQIMPAKWSYRAVEEVVASAPDYLALVRALGALGLMVAALAVATGLALRLKEGLDA